MEWAEEPKVGPGGKTDMSLYFFSRVGPDPGPTEGSDTIPIRLNRSDLEENVYLQLSE